MAYAHQQPRRDLAPATPIACPYAPAEAEGEQQAWGNAAAAEALFGQAPTCDPMDPMAQGGPATCTQPEAGGEQASATERFERELAKPRPDGGVLFDALMDYDRGPLVRIRNDAAIWSRVVAACSKVQVELIEERVAVNDAAVERDPNVWLALERLKAWMGDQIATSLADNLVHGELSLGRTRILPLPREATDAVTLTEATREQMGGRAAREVRVVLRAPELAVIPTSVGPLRTTVRVVPVPARTRVELANPTQWAPAAWTVPDIDVYPIEGTLGLPEVRWT
jgi:hypothetical protein